MTRSNSGCAAPEKWEPTIHAQMNNDPIHSPRLREFIASLEAEIGGRITAPILFTSKLASSSWAQLRFWTCWLCRRFLPPHPGPLPWERETLGPCLEVGYPRL